MSLLDKKIIHPLEVGQHDIQIIDYSEGIASNGNEYVTISYKADAERFVRNRALFEMEFGLFSTNVANQIGYKGDDLNELFEQLRVQPFKVWVVRNVVNNKEYFNWYYKEPAEKHITTVEDLESEEL